LLDAKRVGELLYAWKCRQEFVFDVRGASSLLQEHDEMPKSKEQKKKDRERKVAQKKYAEVQKRTQDQKASDLQKAGQKTNILAAAVATALPPTTTDLDKSLFGGRRSM
jgi:hypothetical protein